MRLVQTTNRSAVLGMVRWSTLLSGWIVASLCVAPFAAAAQPAVEQYKKDIQPILAEFCFDCHADGSKKGNVAFDGFASEEELVQKRDLWFAVLKNIRTGVMPPAKKDRPSAEQTQKLEQWIKYQAFGIDPEHPDPGRVTLRRLNRVEYRNTIRDLMGVDYRTDEEFPPDDTGYGFDTIADVLTISPLLLEKYMEAAEKVVQQSVPTVSKMIKERTYGGASFRGEGTTGERMTFYKAAKVTNTVRAEQAGTYRLHVNLIVSGAFGHDP